MKINYFNSLVFGIFCLTISFSNSQNLLTDGDFSTTTEIIPFDASTPPINAWAYWVNYYGNGSEANPIVVDGVCNFHIINPGNATWNVQLAQWGFSLLQGHSYQLSFDVKADSNRSFGVYLGENEGNWTNLIGNDRYLYDATTEWQTIRVEFEAYTMFPLHKLSFELGADSTTTYFDNIVLTDLGPGEPKLLLAGLPPSGSTVEAGPEDLNGELDFVTTNFTVGEPGTITEGDGYISWSITNITDGGTLHDGGSIYDISVSTSFITLLPNREYYLSSFLVDNDGAPLGYPESAYTLTVNTFGYNVVADISSLRAHVAANGEGLYYEITGASLVNHKNDFHNRLWLQDSHISGLTIVDIDAVISTDFSIGDKVTGLKGQARYLNDTKITLIPSRDSGVVESSGNPVIPQVVTISDFNSDYVNYESEIIELKDVTIAEGNGFAVFNPGSIYHVTDANMNTVLMYIDYWDADHVGTVIPNSTLSSLVAVAGHYGGVAQIYPTSLSDFTQGSSNLLYDGDFSLTTEIIPFNTPNPPINAWAFWVNYYGNGSEAYPTVVDGVCNFHIINPGDETWNVQLGQWGFPLIQGHSYQLMFDVKADSDRLVGVFLGEDGGNYTNLIGFDRYFYNVTPEWQTISIDFDAFAIFPLHKLSFELGTDNTTTYFDNIVLIDLGVQEHSIGILGTAVNGWDVDVDMTSTDGINYTLTNYSLLQGEAKFRQDNSWDINWGSFDFPNGFAYINGPNIPILEGTYNVNFNRLSGEYNFIATTCPNPEIQCPWDIYVENFAGMCGAYVDYPDVVPFANCGGDGITLEQTEGLPSGSFFPVGTTTNMFVLTNSTGDTATCSFNVTVFDIEPPVIADLKEIYEPLWPANHKMVPVFIEYITLDNCNIATTEIYISSNEPENGLGDGDKSPDWEVVDEHHVLLRAERSGKGNGREYYISIIATDDSGNETERQIMVSVPHDKGKNEKVNTFELGNNKFTLYPNATDNIINVKGLNTTSNNPSYSIYDMFGVIKKTGALFNDQIVVRSLPQGIYIIKFKTDKGYVFKKFIKK